MLQLQTPAPPAGTAAPGSQGAANIASFLPFVLIIVIFYFFVIAPQRKRQKKVQEMLGNLKNGDKVVTSGGILGTIVRVNAEDDSVKLRIAPSVEIEVTRSSVAGIQSEPSAGS